MMTLALRKEIVQYVQETISLRQLEDWLTPRLATYLTPPDNDDTGIVSAIELGLAELNAGLYAEDIFRQQLADALRAHPASVLALSTLSDTTVASDSTIERQHSYAQPYVSQSFSATAGLRQ